MEKIRLKNTTIDVDVPKIDFWINRIRKNEPFSYSKLNHAFWEMLIGKEYISKIFHDIHGSQLIYECVSMLPQIPEDGNYFQGVSNYGPIGVPIGPANEMQNAIEFYFKNKKLYLGVMWKQYCLNGSVRKFIHEIREKRVVFVGLPHIEDVGRVWGVKNHEFIPISIYNASNERHKTLEKLKKEKDAFIIFQCGEMLSFWFIQKLHEMKKRNFLIDMGRSLDLYSRLSELESKTIEIFDIKNAHWSRSYEKFNAFDKIIIPYHKKFLQNTLADYIANATGYKIVKEDSEQKELIVKLPQVDYVNFFCQMTCFAFLSNNDNKLLMPKFEIDKELISNFGIKL